MGNEGQKSSGLSLASPLLVTCCELYAGAQTDSGCQCGNVTVSDAGLNHGPRLVTVRAGSDRRRVTPDKPDSEARADSGDRGPEANPRPAGPLTRTWPQLEGADSDNEFEGLPVR